jgi:hypothetical protein
MRYRTLLPALLLMSSALLAAAAEGMPVGLPYESVVLRDGRQLTGHYDEAQGVLWLDGAGSPRLRVDPDDIVKRTAIVLVNGKKPPAASSDKSAPLPTTPPSLEAQQLAINALERQLTDLDRKMLTSREEVTKFNAHIQEWLKVYAKAQKAAEADPGTGLGFENNASYNLTKIRSEIRAVRELLTRAQETVARQTERRQELLANLQAARQALTETIQNPTATVTVYTVETAPHTNVLLEQRVESLEAELRRMQQDNERLRQILDALTTPKPTPTPTQPSQSESPDGLVAVNP